MGLSVGGFRCPLLQKACQDFGHILSFAKLNRLLREFQLFAAAADDYHTKIKEALHILPKVAGFILQYLQKFWVAEQRTEQNILGNGGKITRRQGERRKLNQLGRRVQDQEEFLYLLFK